MSFVRTALAATVCGMALSTTACGPLDAETGDPSDATVAVQPRVVMDGLVELAAREQGHVQITEVVFHAPEVTRVDAVGHDQLAGHGADDDLLFRYAIGADNGFCDLVGGERHWQLDGAGDLVFRFAPADDDDVAVLARETGVDLSALVGRTAYVRGTVAVETSAVRGFACGAVAEGDPDTAPAGCALDQRAEGDPDTSPADGTGDAEDAEATGDESEGDPDTAPATPSAEEGDPDTAPAAPSAEEGDPDTAPASPNGEGDPDTSPAKGDDANAAHRRDDGFTTRPGVGIGDAPTMQHVPFVLVIEDGFALRRPVEELRIGELSKGEVLPIDLLVDMNALFSPEQVAALDRVARGAKVESTVLVSGSVDGAVRIKLDAKAVKKVAAQTPGIRVVGDLR